MDFSPVKRVPPPVLLVLLAAMSGCQTPGGPPAAQPVPEAAQAAAGQAVLSRCFELNGDASELRVLVYRAGPLARVGHNHVLVSRAVRGRLAVTDPVTDSRLSLVLPVSSLEIDPPALRAEEGPDFSSEVSDEARAGTRKNLLGEGVLDASAYPEVHVGLSGWRGPSWAADATLELSVRGHVADKAVAVSVTEDASTLTATSAFTVSHQELGMVPFSALGGGLRVADDIRIRAKLEFERTDAADVGACIGGEAKP
jgi:hypothetical protein